RGGGRRRGPARAGRRERPHHPQRAGWLLGDRASGRLRVGPHQLPRRVAVIEAVVFDVGGVLLLPSGDRIASVLGDALGLDLDPGACRDGWTRALAAIEIDVYHGREPVVLDDAFLEVARRMLTMLGRESATSLLES